MANLNKVMLIGRLTRDPEEKVFQSGGKVANFGFAVNHRRKDNAGEWVDEAVFLDVKAFNRGGQGRQLADQVMQHFTKGKQFYLEGKLTMEQWDDKATGAKRQAIRILLDDYQFLDKKDNGEADEDEPARPARKGEARQGALPMASGQDDIPF